MLTKKKRRVIGLVAEEEARKSPKALGLLVLGLCLWQLSIRARECSNKVAPGEVPARLERLLSTRVGGQEAAKAKALRAVREKPVRICLTSSARGSGKSLFAQLIATSFYGIESKLLNTMDILVVIALAFCLAAIFSSPLIAPSLTIVAVALYSMQFDNKHCSYPEQCGVAWFSGEVILPLPEYADLVVLEHYNSFSLSLQDPSVVIVVPQTNATCPPSYEQIKLQPLQAHALDDAIDMIVQQELTAPIRSAASTKGLRWLGIVELDETIRQQIHVSSSRSGRGGHAVLAFFRDIDLMPALDALLLFHRHKNDNTFLANLLLMMKNPTGSKNSTSSRHTFEWKIIDLLLNDRS